MIEIDSIRDALHAPITEAGDYISDEYWQVIDLSTAPGLPSQDRTSRLASAIRNLNHNIGTTCVELDVRSPEMSLDLVGVYNGVIRQLNELNASNPNLGALNPISAERKESAGYSGNFRWANSRPPYATT